MRVKESLKIVGSLNPLKDSGMIPATYVAGANFAGEACRKDAIGERLSVFRHFCAKTCHRFIGFTLQSAVR